MFKTTALDHVGNQYIDEDIPTSTPGTRLEADDRNIVQDELVALVEGAGLTLDPTGANRDQLLEAMTILGLTTKNAIINGSMNHAQRGASGSALFDVTTTPLNSDDTYLLDRWLLLSNGNDVVDVSQSTDAPTGALLSQALDVETINLKFGVLQIIEQKNCQHMIGSNVSLSFEAKVSDITKLDNIKAMVISWDGAADAPTSDIISAWNAEDTTPTLVANWTAENTPANLSVTAAFAKYKIENIAIDTAATKNIGVFIWSDGFCDTLGKILRITNVQLEKNSVATEYDWIDVAVDLAKCQHSYCKSYDQGTVPGTTTLDGIVSVAMTALANADHDVSICTRFSVVMRAIPTIISYDGVGASGKARTTAGDGKIATIAQQTDSGFTNTATNGATATVRQLSYHYTAEAEIGV